MTSQESTGGGAAPESPDGLAALRARLDEVDARLLDAIRQRIECCTDIAHFKRVNEVQMMQPHRIEFVQQRAARYGERHGIDPAFLRRLYGVIIDETCRIEDLLIDGGPAG